MDTDARSFIDQALATFEHALHDRGSDLRNLQLATLSPEGRPGLRTVVLRQFDRAAPTAEFHSDARAAKCRDIAYARDVSLLAWSAADKLQLRFEGPARIHRTDDFARARGDALAPNARKAYGWRSSPGHTVAEPGLDEHLPPDEQFQQFAVVIVSLANIDVLRLEGEGGQTRAYGRFMPSGLEASWVGP